MPKVYFSWRRRPINNLIHLLGKFNFTESEAKAYMTLLQNGPSTGYEISKISGIPRSKIYNLLETLIGKGVVLCTKNTNPVYYNAIPAEELAKNLKQDYDSAILEIKEGLKTFDSQMNLEYVWFIRGYKNIFNKYKNILQDTKEELHIQIWKEDLKHIHKELKTVENKGVKMLVILYGADKNEDIGIKNVYKHGFEKEKLQEMGGRWITLVSDSKEVLFGHIQNPQQAEVIWTESKPLVLLAKEYVKHDAYFYRLMGALGNAVEETFGSDLSDVREIYEKFSNRLQY